MKKYLLPQATAVLTAFCIGSIPLTASADCTASVDRALARLELQVTGALEDPARQSARLVLQDLCMSGADSEVTTRSTASVVRACDCDDQAPEIHPVLLGVEVEKEVRRKPGHERLKRNH